MYIAVEFVAIPSCQGEERFVNKKNAVMFNQISWATYIEMVVYSIVVYYAFILYKYYRHDLLIILNRKHNSPVPQVAVPPSIQPSTLLKGDTSNPTDFMPKENQDNMYSPMVQSLGDEIKAFLVEAGSNEFEREPIILSLQLLIGKYPLVNLLPYKESINELVAQECATNCSVHLSDEELDGLWV